MSLDRQVLACIKLGAADESALDGLWLGMPQPASAFLELQSARRRWWRGDVEAFIGPASKSVERINVCRGALKRLVLTREALRRDVDTELAGLEITEDEQTQHPWLTPWGDVSSTQ